MFYMYTLFSRLKHIIEFQLYIVIKLFHISQSDVKTLSRGGRGVRCIRIFHLTSVEVFLTRYRVKVLW